MKKIFLSFIILGIAFQVQSQEWQTNLTKAKEIAAEKTQAIVLVFQGSDWCAPCMKLDKEIWSTESFKTYAADNYVMLKADFPRRKANRLAEDQQAHNDKLAEKFNQKGYFPHVVILNSKEEVLGRLGYKKVSPEEYINLIDNFIH
jgi:thioredoxin-related protein